MLSTRFFVFRYVYPLRPERITILLMPLNRQWGLYVFLQVKFPNWTYELAIIEIGRYSG